jgi:hypothetical protein
MITTYSQLLIDSKSDHPLTVYVEYTNFQPPSQSLILAFIILTNFPTALVVLCALVDLFTYF